MQNLFDLTGKKALVTGGSKGIGNRLARGLHDAGAEVVIFYNSTYSEQMAQEMQGDGPAVYAIQCNVADRASLDSAVAQAAEKLGGRIDILINAAGINRQPQRNRILLPAGRTIHASPRLWPDCQSGLYEQLRCRS